MINLAACTAIDGQPSLVPPSATVVSGVRCIECDVTVIVVAELFAACSLMCSRSVFTYGPLDVVTTSWCISDASLKVRVCWDTR